MTQGLTKSRQLLLKINKYIIAQAKYLWYKSNYDFVVKPGRNILFVDDMLPIATFGAGYPRAAEIVEALTASGWHVWLYPMYAKTAHYRTVAKSLGSEVTPIRSAGIEGLSRILQTRASHFKVVLISRPGPIKAFAKIVAARPAIREATAYIYDAEALLASREILRRRLLNAPMSDEAERRAIKDELDLASLVRTIWAVTGVEAAQFQKHLGVSAFVVSHGFPIRTDAPGVMGRQDFLFVGRLAGSEYHSPNVDSLIWFVERVMPALDETIGKSYRLRVVGLADNAIRERVQSERVVFEGVLQDTRPLYDTCRVFVAPTRFSAGLSHKVCEALAMGLPCVATDQLREQAELASECDILNASSDKPEAFAASCARLYVDDELWRRLQEQGLLTMKARFSSEEFRKSVIAGLRSC